MKKIKGFTPGKWTQGRLLLNSRAYNRMDDKGREMANRVEHCWGYIHFHKDEEGRNRKAIIHSPEHPRIPFEQRIKNVELACYAPEMYRKLEAIQERLNEMKNEPYPEFALGYYRECLQEILDNDIL